jgi:predicted ArsR family transcriptional regulator
MRTQGNGRGLSTVRQSEAKPAAYLGVFVTTVDLGHVRPIDQTVLELLRQHQGLTVVELSEQLEVTATAVRQRLDRLVEVDLVARRKEGVGRGRPVFRYHLTQLGQRYSSASYADLAAALWQEILELPNIPMRKRLMRRVAKRMGDQLKGRLPLEAPLDAKLSAMAEELGRRKVAAEVKLGSGLPVLEVHSCPYPDLTTASDNRQLCELEQEMLSAAIGHSVQLDCCRLDGHSSCQFRPVIGLEAPAPSLESHQLDR